MTDTEMMQRVVAILTQAREIAEAWEEDEERDLTEQSDLIGELIAETMRLNAITPASAAPQDVADAVAAALQPRIGLLAACFTAAFTRLAAEHDAGKPDANSADVLRRLVLEWELDDETA